MITLYNRDKGIYCSFEGFLQRIPTKIGNATYETALGRRKSEHIRNVIDINATIEYMSVSEYHKLEIMFLTANNSLEIEDLDNGILLTDYFITGDTLALTEKDDIEEHEKYYLGGLALGRR